VRQALGWGRIEGSRSRSPVNRERFPGCQKRCNLCNLKPAVHEILERGRFPDLIGGDCVFDAEDDAIRAIYARLDSDGCRSCDAQIFIECAATLPDGSPREAAQRRASRPV
jgi:hypothetical protein